MDKSKPFLLFEMLGDIMKISNQSKFNVIISLKPKRPKRKYVDIAIVSSETFTIYDPAFDLSKISISFEEIKKTEDGSGV